MRIIILNTKKTEQRRVPALFEAFHRDKNREIIWAQELNSIGDEL